MDFNVLLKELSTKRSQDIAFTFLPNPREELHLSYSELYQKSFSIALNLFSETKNTPILLLFNPGLNFVKALLGCLLSGNIAVPIPIPKPQQLNVVRKIMENCGTSYILSEPELIARYSKELNEYQWINILEVLNSDLDAILPIPKSDDIAILQYTSGSTGNPKGVMVTYDNLEHNLHAIVDHFVLGKNSISFSWLPHYHDMGLIDGILQPLVSGCHGILTSPRQVIGRPEFWLDCITKYNVNYTGGPNFFFQLCVDKVHKNKNWELSSLKDIYVSAEPIRIQTLKTFSKKFKPFGLPDEIFTPAYGLAEATLLVSCKKVKNSIQIMSFEHNTRKIEAVSLGKLISGVSAKIVDPESGRLVDDEPGELYLKGRSITKGYWKNVQETQNTFQTSVNDHEVWLKTGDNGVFKGKELYILGRSKDLIIINGVNYYAEDIEHTLSEAIQELLPDSCLAIPIDGEKHEEFAILIKVRKDMSLEILSNIEDKARSTLFHSFGLSEGRIHLHSGPSYAKTTSGKIRRAFNKTLFLKDTFNIISLDK